VRRHVPGVGCSRCDAGIALSGGNPFVGKRRIVLSMNEIVRHSGMLRVLFVQLF
jgi:hypothetical protein